jgi:DNA polymerase I
MILKIDLPDVIVADSFDTIKKTIGDSKFLAIDTETTGRSIKEKYTVLMDTLLCFTIATDKFRIFVPPELVYECAEPIFNNPEISKIFHNAKYDLHILENCGVHVSGTVFDTMIMYWLLDSEEKSLGLGDLSEKLIPKTTKVKSFKELFNNDFLVGDIALSQEYATYDAYVTYLLFIKLKGLLEKTPWRGDKSLYDYYTGVESDFIKVLLNMERRGIEINKERLKEISIKLEESLVEILTFYNQLAGHPINVSSSQQMGELFFNKLKMPIPEYNGKPKIGEKSGKPSVDVYVLNKLVMNPSYSKYVTPLIKYRSESTLLNTFVKPILKKIDLYDGKRLYPQFNIANTETGRLSSSNPNSQNIPKKADTVGLRKVFCASKEHKLICGDLSQAEIYIMAHICDDSNMIKDCETGDFYTTISKKVFNINTLSDDQRSTMKTVILGLNYARSAKMICYELNNMNEQKNISKRYTEEEIKKLISRYFNQYPKFYDYYWSVHRTAYRYTPPAIRTLLGRYRHIKALNSDDERIRAGGRREALNAGPQSGVADIMRCAMITIEKNQELRDLGCKLLLQIHDELIMEVPEANAERAKELSAGIITDAYKNFGVFLKVNLKVSIAISDFWVKT